MKTQDQFLTAYNEFSDAIFRHCYFRIYSREKAKDLMQETFCRTWQYLSEGKDIDNLRAFLYRVANNLIIDDARKKKELSLDALQEEGFNPADTRAHLAMVTTIEGKEMIGVLNKIEPGYREVILMRYLDDLQPKEIARILDESENVVSVRIHRGIKKVREYLDGQLNSHTAQ